MKRLLNLTRYVGDPPSSTLRHSDLLQAKVMETNSVQELIISSQSHSACACDSRPNACLYLVRTAQAVIVIVPLMLNYLQTNPSHLRVPSAEQRSVLVQVHAFPFLFIPVLLNDTSLSVVQTAPNDGIIR
jgi:hypothetical protein